MYYGDVIASKQVTYSDASITISPSLSFRLWIPQVRGQPHGFFFSIQLDCLHPPCWAVSLPCCSNHYLSLQNTSCKNDVKSTDGEVAVFVRESASLVTGKRDKMDTDHEASTACTDLARWQKKDTEIGPIVRLQTEYERWVGVKWLWNRWDELEVGYVRNGLLYRWFISNCRNEEHWQCYLLVSQRCVEIVLYDTHIPAWRKTEMSNFAFLFFSMQAGQPGSSISVMRCRLMLSFALLVMLYS